MNLGIVTSFIIAAILLIAIVAMNINISQSAGGLTLQQITQQNVTATADLIKHDMPKIGYKPMGDISGSITYADSTKLAFYSDVDFDGTTEEVVWFYDTSSEVTAGTNPNDYILKRAVEDSSGTSLLNTLLGGGTTTNTAEITFGVTDFDFIYYNEDRITISTPGANPDEIAQIKVEFTIESKEKYGNSGQYTQSVWSKTFTPKNIK